MFIIMFFNDQVRRAPVADLYYLVLVFDISI